jgi:type I restriction enzyme S subunit
MLDPQKLPKDWTVAKLGEIVVTEKGKKPKRMSKEKTKEFSIPYVNIKAFEKRIIDEYTDGVDCVLCKDDDFLMVWDGSRSGYVGKAIKGALGSTLVKIKLPLMNQDYAYYFLQSKFIEINTRAKGVGIPHVDPNLLWNYDFPLPPLPEQKRIVAKLEQLLTDLDKAVEYLKTAQQQLKTYRQAVLKWAFEGKLTNPHVKDGELPEGWKIKTIRDIGEVETGTTPSKKNPHFYEPKDYPFYKPTDLDAGGNVQSSIDGLSELGIRKARFVPVNTILVTCIGATIGKTGLIKKGGGFNQQINAIITFKEYNPKFVFYQAISPSFQNQIKKNASATTLPILNKRKFELLPMITCSLEEQTKIVSAIESRLSVCDKIEEIITNSLQQAEALRLSIIKKAFEGRLLSEAERSACRNDPDWEPAHKLLERIKASRKNHEKTTVKTRKKKSY